MAVTGLPVFDKTVHETNGWLASLAEKLGAGERELAFKVLRATLHALRDQLPPDSAAHLADQLPILLRGVYYEGWHPGATPARLRHKEALLQRVRAELPPGVDLPVEGMVQAVFAVIWEKVEPGEVAKLTRMTPAELRDLWPRVARDD
jgi:uncharacterized protein (DUF2267 family)